MASLKDTKPIVDNQIIEGPPKLHGCDRILNGIFSIFKVYCI